MILTKLFFLIYFKTTAARPTFDPARGNDSKAPSFQYSARDIASHTKLKFRQPGQGTAAEIGDRERLKEELRQAEQEYYQSQGKNGPASDRLLTGNDGGGETKRQRLLAEAEKMAALDKEESDDDDDDDDDDSDDSDDEDESDDDENTAELLATLQRIRKERAEEKERQEREKLEQEAAERDEQAMTGNPLLQIGEQQRDFSVKRRWDDDVIFKNQARGTDEKPNKRFVNDMLRSDFHRRFLHKYIQ
ncbi:Pre-mRNA-splicing factor Cwf15/Cwc15 [Halteromyces radiatus]|uniref:Pre-mRNA-splicing factor Cwf15/Cwc15 n=1 Tax=Halteromyces radiatus TaxID=101107 RepID=UPI00221F46CD|nr:Pre-mRNA-splicing factor Cwf15/Cwc15 [Halteromyces radiatus]KAI8092865.1 Pre-mRNA-splicing factor Cwf15/Cwc15 [Halteromyces radiatus]